MTTLWEGVPTHRIVSDIGRAQRLEDLWQSETGADLRDVLAVIANGYLADIMKGDTTAASKLVGLRDFLDTLGLAIEVGPSLRAELVQRQSKESPNGR